MQAKGDGFFARVKTRLYRPVGSLFGQVYNDTCVAACCRMLLQDQGLAYGEALVRAALEAEIGGVGISAAAQALKELGAPAPYVYSSKMPMADLRKAVVTGAALTFIKKDPQARFGHAVLVDSIKNNWAMIRDPWPPDFGSSYQVRLADFAAVWLLQPSAAGFTGRAGIVE